MRLLMWTITGATFIVERLVRLLAQLQIGLTALLPVVVPPHKLREMLRSFYDDSYQNVGEQARDEVFKWTLEDWEERVVAAHFKGDGTVLVLGAGVGRESIALARLGYRVIGVDINHAALRLAGQRALSEHLIPRFAQADFLVLPIRTRQTDYIMLSGVMYSSIPGRAQRQAYLRSLRDLLRPNGKIILNFVLAREPESRTSRLVDRAGQWLLRLPGTNRAYQRGDTCQHGHFMHVFQERRELETELSQVGLPLVDLQWEQGYAVVG